MINVIIPNKSTDEYLDVIRIEEISDNKNIFLLFSLSRLIIMYMETRIDKNSIV